MDTYNIFFFLNNEKTKKIPNKVERKFEYESDVFEHRELMHSFVI